MIVLATVLAVLLASPARALVLDSTFGVGGKVYDPTLSFGTDVRIEPGTNKIVVITDVDDVARFLPDGSPDDTFGTDGRISANMFFPHRLEIQPLDGKLLVLGGVLRRFEADGDIDMSFGTAGTVTVDETADLLLQPDGKILVAGNNHIFRFLADGTPDPGFGAGGTVETGSFNDPDTLLVAKLALVAGDKIVAAGVTRENSAFLRLARYGSDGTLDTTFGTGGYASASIDVNGHVLLGLLRQGDEKLVAWGRRGDVHAVMRFLADGTLDTSYGSAGVTLMSNLRLGNSSSGGAIVLDSGGGVIIASDSVLVRLTPGGVLDGAFAPCVFLFNGFLGRRSPTPTGGTEWVGMTQQPDGKLVVVGEAAGSVSGFGMIRYAVGNPICHPASPRSSRLAIRPEPHKLSPKFKWTWRSFGTVAFEDLGNPLVPDGDSYALCLLDSGDPPGLRGTIFQDPAEGGCPPPCWKGTLTGYKFKRQESIGDGTARLSIRFRSGGPRQATIKVAGRDEGTHDVTEPPYTLPTVVRFVRSGTPFCWEATFPAASRNEVKGFSATSYP